MTQEVLISPDDLAHELGIPEATLRQWRYVGRGPRFHRVGRHVRYRRADIETWLRANAVDPGAA